MDDINSELDYYINACNTAKDGIIVILEFYCYDIKSFTIIYYDTNISTYFIGCQFNMKYILSFGWHSGYIYSNDDSSDEDKDENEDDLSSEYTDADFLRNCMYNKTVRELTLPDGTRMIFRKKYHNKLCEILEHMQENNWTLPVFEEALGKSAFSAGLK